MTQAARTLDTQRLRQPHAKAQVITLLDLVAALAESGATETEVVAAVTDLVNSGRVQLVGNFRGADVRIG